jgi:SAM-dependent methyltransferase
VEGIEHIENPHVLIKEFARVVKRGGYLIVSTPNVMTIKSRLRFLFYSYLDYFRYFGPPPLEEKHKIKEYEHQHLNPVFYGEMKFILEKYGFKIEKVETNRMVRKWNIIFPLIKWFIKYKTRKKFPGDPLFVSDVILEGEDLIVIAKHELEIFPKC